MVFALVAHPGQGADPRSNAEPPSNAASKLWRPANGPRRRRRSPYRSMAPRGVTTRCDQRSCHRGGYFYVPVGRGVCPLQVQGTSRGPALPRGDGWGRGGRVCWGQAPEQCRSARPRVKARGRSVCRQNQTPRATGATDARCGPYGAPASAANAQPRMSASQPKALATPGGPFGHL
jgi:hypothetical protein